MVRLVDAAFEQVDMRLLLRGHKEGAKSSYHPKLMLKVLVSGYKQRVYSSRQIAKALLETVNFNAAEREQLAELPHAQPDSGG